MISNCYIGLFVIEVIFWQNTLLQKSTAHVIKPNKILIDSSVCVFQIKKVKLVGFRKKSCTGKTPTNSGEAREDEDGELIGRGRQDDPEDSIQGCLLGLILSDMDIKNVTTSNLTSSFKTNLG